MDKDILTSRRIRLAIVTETWTPDVNGVAITLKHLVEGLVERDDYEIQLVRPRYSSDEEPAVSPALREFLVAGFNLPFYPDVRLGLSRVSSLTREWTKNPPDIVQIVTEGPLGWAAMKAANRLGISVISDFHTNFDQYTKYYRLGFFTWLVKRYLKRFHNQSLITLVPTYELMHSMSEEGYTKLGLLQRGIDTQLFNPLRYNESVREGLGIYSGDFLVVTVSRIANEKNLDLVFEAFRAIKAVKPYAHFVIVGDGPERSRLQAENPDCLFVGVQTGEALAEYYASSDLFLYPSTSETYGNVVMEAMASGLPVVAFDYAAAHLHIKSGINGITVPVDDNDAFICGAIELSQDSSLRIRLGMAAHQTAKPLNWAYVVEQIHHIFRNTVENQGHETNPSTQRSRNPSMPAV